MDDQLNGIFLDTLAVPPEVVQKIRTRIQQDTQPVKPMPASLPLALLLTGVFCFVSILFAGALGFKGWRALPLSSAWGALALLLVLALSCGVMVARAMRPGSGSLHNWILAAVSLVAYEGLVLTTFSDYSTALFIHQGVACLSAGIACAAVAAVPVWLIVRRGFVVNAVAAGALIGLLCGLAGLTALTLHCNVMTATHAGFWHASVIVICVAVGALTGRFATRQNLR